MRVPAAVFVAVGIAAAAAVLIAAIDAPPPDTSDLVPERIELPPGQNAFTHFASATNSLYWPTNASALTACLSAGPVDEAAVSEIIARNAETLRAIEQGLECGACLAPEATGFATPLPHLGPWRNIGRVLAMKARRDRLAGRHADAAGACATLLGFGDMILQDGQCLVSYLVGLAVLEMGLAQARAVALDEATAPEDLARLARALAGLHPLDRGLVRAMKTEYRFSAAAIDQIRGGEIGASELVGLGWTRPGRWLGRRRIPLYFFQPNRTKQDLASLHREMIRDASRCYADMKHRAAEGPAGSAAARALFLAKPNALGRCLQALLAPAFDSVLERKCRAECGVAAARLAAACGAYAKKEGRLPADLQSLVPACLPAVPADPFDGKPFRYSPSAGIVYSVGKDLRDSGGSARIPAGREQDTPSKRRWESEDAVFKIRAGPGQED
jgi:hypothetical protein